MTRKLPSTIQGLKAVIHRRKWPLLITTVGVAVVVCVGSLLLPKQYKSDTLILVEPQKVPEDYVHATVTTDVTDRLQTLSKEILSRTRLSSIIQDLDLYPELRKKKSMDEVVAIMRNEITVDVLPTSDPDKHTAGAFTISYLGATPQKARDVTKMIANLFIQDNLQVREQQAQGTRQFISAEADTARQQLEAEEQKIRAFNAAHLGTLPEQEQTNLQLLNEYQVMAQANTEALDRAAQQRVYMQSMLSVTDAKKKVAAPPLSPLQIELQQKKHELQAAEQKYTDEYPDVVRLKEEVAGLQAQAKAEGPVAARATEANLGPDQADQFKGQVTSLNQEIGERSNREKQLEGQIAALQGRIQVLPQVQSEFADLSREYQDMQKNYQSLMDKEAAAGMAADLEHHDKSEQFRILDPANLPTKPYSPNLALIDGAGILAAIMLGLLLALILEVRDTSLHDLDDVEHYLGIPIISAIPRISEGLPAKRTKPRELMAAS